MVAPTGASDTTGTRPLSHIGPTDAYQKVLKITDLLTNRKTAKGTEENSPESTGDDVRKTIHDEIVKRSEYGREDGFTTGYIAGLLFVLHCVVEADGENRTGCKAFDLENQIKDLVS